MIKLFSLLFRKKPAPPDDDAIIEEEWSLDPHGKPSAQRFRPISEARYQAWLDRSGLNLRLDASSLFAWAENPIHRQRDLSLEADIVFRDLPPRLASDPPRAAAGILFRYNDEGDFYALMVSDSGHLRLDAVFSGHPRPIIPWTETGHDCSGRFVLGIVARDTRFTFLVNGSWVAEAQDDTFDSGYIAFAAQCYAGLRGLSATLESLHLDSRPLSVETAAFRFSAPPFLKGEARLRLAETLLGAGQSVQAAVQLRKLQREDSLTVQGRFLLAEAFLRCGLRDEAEEALDQVLREDGGHRQALIEKANVLYLGSRFLELKEACASALERVGDDPVLRNLSGHARHNLGDFEGAAADYRAAWAADPSQPLYALNAARSLEAAGRTEDAAALSLDAARGFFDAEEWTDLDAAMDILERLRPGSEEALALKGKTAYQQGRTADAKEIFSKLIGSGSADPSIFYLQALILSAEGKRSESIALLERACAGEPSFPLYRFRLAEARYLAGQDARADLEQALLLAPEDGWTQNLRGLLAMEAGNLEEAAQAFDRAALALPGESAVLVNRSELLLRRGDADGALSVLAGRPMDATLRNQEGNVLAAAGRLEEALAAYDRAVALDPSNADYRLNRAACRIELDQYFDAESDLRAVLSSRPDEGRAFLLMGRIAEIYGDWPRAEMAFRTAMEAAPADPALLRALADVYLGSGRWAKAAETIEAMEAAGLAAAPAYRQRLREATHERLSCATCGMEWMVPRDLPPQGTVRLHGEPPDDSPAGLCPSCGRVFCVGCRKDDLDVGRLVCPDCRAALKLSDNRLKYLALRAADESAPSPAGS